MWSGYVALLRILNKAVSEHVETRSILRYLDRLTRRAVAVGQAQLLSHKEVDDFVLRDRGGYFRTRRSELVHGVLVERSHQHLVLHVVLADQLAERPGHRLAFHQLYFDVHRHVGEGLEQLFDGCHGNALAAIGKGLAVVGSPSIACVQRFDLGQGHILQTACAVGGAIYGLVMHQDQATIAGNVQVHLQHVHAHGDGTLEGIHRVARPKPVTALMGDHQWSWLVAQTGWTITGWFGQQNHGDGDDSQYANNA